MEYILLTLISFSGLFFGILLALNSPEELKDNRKNFLILKYISLLALLFYFMIFYFDKYLISVLSLLLVLYYVFTHSRLKDVVAYSVFGVFFYLNHSLLIISLLLIFGFAEGTLVRHDLIKKHWRFSFYRVIENYSVFIIIALLLHYI